MTFGEFLELNNPTMELGCQVNCSEATIRIDLRGEDEKKIKQLIEKLELEMTDISPSSKDWDDEKDNKEFEMSEGYVSQKDIFGLPILEITGDAPFNFSDDIETMIKRYLPKAKMEWCE